ncbi:hypothetical protein [Hanstruepera ponticola]|uniref:hypothetical protein n=1 Tax=Hanstruepera ponticola TaxID=2042995 RepID=UPI000CF03A52|nr:hypothetical protein [Hanstruepera ponticola]
MEKHLDKKLEKLSDKMMKESGLEKPSFNFTNAVMERVEKVSANQITEYKPLISKQAWFVIAVALLPIAYIIVNNSSSSNSNWFDVIDFNSLFNYQFIDNMFSVTISKTVLYTIVLFGLMLCVQIPILKNYFDKRFEV